jgi:hypothetical protein
MTDQIYSSGVSFGYFSYTKKSNSGCGAKRPSFKSLAGEFFFPGFLPAFCDSRIIRKSVEYSWQSKYISLLEGLVRNFVKATILLTIMFMLCISASAQSVKAEQEAITAAKAWLELIDNGDYGKSWDDSAEIFQNALTKVQWKQTLTPVRKPLGKVIYRNLKSAHYATSLPGAPDGEYVVIQFETSFENKKSSVETVTPMRQKNGEWNVAGYYIK